MCWRPSLTCSTDFEWTWPEPSDEDGVPPEVTDEVNRLIALVIPYQAPSVDELLPKRDVYGTRSNELLDPRSVETQRSLPRCVGKKCYSWFHDWLCCAAPRLYEASSSST